ncbi:hypothetical protein AVE30378_03088 [Achromobacter veterisilvae]|uniref:DUF5343 domain-containing protein n=1 Tax=Achromobacter veterisilvae TaxID=2069367 RepID=A0A446CL65_9BURK|nr:DUF5343 domain-containing protein [Achromobacter veterisilvae]SSW68629.1 hypothetical protein AVE30378_03088 [Achromobacter veterisilvae]
MADKTTLKPPYASYRSFSKLMEDLRAHPVLPGVIDRHYLSKRSGSERAALVAALRWFGLVDEEGVPTEALTRFITANEAEQKSLLAGLVHQSYAFMSDGTINLANATTGQMAERFRQYEISGSTLTKSITFFLAAAREAGIELSPHVKAPAAPAANGTAKKRSKQSLGIPAAAPASEVPSAVSTPMHPNKPGRIYIPIPIFGDQGMIELPDQMDERQWASVIKMTEFILKNYRDTMATPFERQADDGGEE